MPRRLFLECGCNGRPHRCTPRSRNSCLSPPPASCPRRRSRNVRQRSRPKARCCRPHCRSFRRTTGGTSTFLRRPSIRSRRASSPSSTTAARGSSHPDFGGEASPGSEDIYGIPYVIVDGSQPKKAVTFEYWDESDGVNLANGQGIPFYPIPAQSITQAHWIEGGAPGSVDQRSDSDRHLIVVDCTNRHLYELYNVWYDASLAEVVRRLRRFLRHECEPPAARHVDVRRCGRARDLPGARSLRRGMECRGDGHRPRLSRDRSRDERLCLPGVASRRIDDGRAPDGRTTASEDERRRTGPCPSHPGSERPKDLSRDAEVRLARGRQRLRHVHHRHLRHPLEQRHPESGIRNPVRERFRSGAAGMEPAASGCRGTLGDQRESRIRSSAALPPPAW